MLMQKVFSKNNNYFLQINIINNFSLTNFDGRININSFSINNNLISCLISFSFITIHNNNFNYIIIEISSNFSFENNQKFYGSYQIFIY